MSLTEYSEDMSIGKLLENATWQRSNSTLNIFCYDSPINCLL